MKLRHRLSSEAAVASWSLGVEEQLYLVWPLLLAAVVRVRRMLLVTVAGLCIASLVTAESSL